MKRITLFVSLFLIGQMSFAQLDTVHWGNPNYFWDAYFNFDSIDMAYCHETIPGEEDNPNNNAWAYCYKRFVFDKGELPLIGVAFPLYPIGHWHIEDWFLNGVLPYIDLKIFQGQTPYTLLDSVRIPRSSLRSTVRASHFFEYTLTDSCDLNISGHHVDTLWEIHFSHPVAVHDTFWIGFNGYHFLATQGVQMFAEAPFADQWVAANPQYSSGPDDPDHWHYWRMPKGGFWLPVIQPDEDTIDFSSCEVPASPVLDLYDGTFASISWQSPAASNGIELSFGTDISNPDLYPPIPLYSFQIYHEFPNLPTGQFYAVWLRNLCRHHCEYHDTTWHSDWSDPLVFYLPTSRPNHDTLWLSDTTYLLGGDIITLGDNLIVIDGQRYVILGADTIPADDPSLIWLDDSTFVCGGQVGSGSRPSSSILSPDDSAILRQEYYDLLGRRLAQPPSRGLYLLRTTTPQGTSTRKIVKL